MRFLTIATVSLLSLLFALPAAGQRAVRQNIPFSLENKNDAILQVENKSDMEITVEIRIVIADEIYRHPADLAVPAKESRFLRIVEVLSLMSERFSSLKGVTSGILQTQYTGENQQIEATIVNLDPRQGLTTRKSTKQGAVPQIKSLEPKSGATGGGTVVSISGSNFTEATVVKFGGTSALRSLRSPQLIVAVTPPHKEGSVDVEVLNGQRRSALQKAFTYEQGAPQIDLLEPVNGPLAGGGLIQIRGKNFQPGTRVLWNGKPVLSKFVSPEQITVTCPAGTRGTVPVQIINPDGGQFLLENAFRYQGGVRIRSTQPDTGTAAGGYQVTIQGEHFDSRCRVLFDGKYGDTTYLNPTSLSAVVPSGESGTVNVSVSTEDGETDTLRDAFLYNEVPRILSITAVPNPIVRNTTTTISVEATDPEAGLLDYVYRIAQGTGTLTPQGRTAVYGSPNITGNVLIQVTVYDQHGAKAQQNLEIRVE